MSIKYTLDVALGSFGYKVRTADSQHDWAEVHRYATKAFEETYDTETEAIKNGTPPSDTFNQREVIVTLTHKIVTLQGKIRALAISAGVVPND